jgi:hypothetical protein
LDEQDSIVQELEAHNERLCAKLEDLMETKLATEIRLMGVIDRQKKIIQDLRREVNNPWVCLWDNSTRRG